MAEFPSACFVPSDEETLEKWQNDCTYDDEEKMLYFPVYEEEKLFWPIANKINKKYHVLIEYQEQEDVPCEFLEGCLKLVNEVEELRDGNIAKALKKGIELKMPVSFHF